MSSLEQQPYFEKQSWLRCGLHAVNNLLGFAAFSPNEFDSLAKELTAHYVPLLGHYAFEVLQFALSKHNLCTLFLERRKPIRNEALGDDGIRGLIIHAPSTGWFSSAHWYAVRRHDEDRWMNVNSKLESPEVVECAVSSSIVVAFRLTAQTDS